MKKILIISLLLISTIGCDLNAKISKDKEKYQELINKVNLAPNKNFYLPLPFSIRVYIDKVIESEITYRLIIDNPTEELRDVVVLIVHNYPTKDIFPSIGIFDDKVNLIPDFIAKDDNYVKGISLTGYIASNKDLIEFDGVFKIIVEYIDELGNANSIYYRYQN